MNRKKIILTFLLCLAGLVLLSKQAHAATYKTTIYLFWGNGCPHCEAEREFLPTLEEKYPELEVKQYEAWYNKENSELFESMSKAYESNSGGVPALFIGDFPPTIGFSSASTTGAQIERQIAYCIQNGCEDPGSKIGLVPVAPPEEYLPPNGSDPSQNGSTDVNTGSTIANLPLIGEIDASKTGILIFTVLVGILDGFNACAMWVLSFLLTLLVYSHSRKRIFLIGGTFIFVSGFMYYLFIAGWMSLFIFAGSLRLIQVSIGLLAIIFGLVSVKDFFWFGKGVSFIIPEKSKKKIIKRMRRVVKPSAELGAALVGVALLAIGVNVVELLCSLGLPAVYTSILNTYDYPPLVNYFFLLIYIIFYMIDDLLIFSVVVMTMSSKKFTEKYGRISKLVSGALILLLGLIMIINPNLLMFG